MAICGSDNVTHHPPGDLTDAGKLRSLVRAKRKLRPCSRAVRNPRVILIRATASSERANSFQTLLVRSHRGKGFRGKDGNSMEHGCLRMSGCRSRDEKRRRLKHISLVKMLNLGQSHQVEGPKEYRGLPLQMASEYLQRGLCAIRIQQSDIGIYWN